MLKSPSLPAGGVSRLERWGREENEVGIDRAGKKKRPHRLTKLRKPGWEGEKMKV